MPVHNKNTLIIIPAHNEEKNIDAVLKGLKQTFRENDLEKFCKILVISDASTDKTIEVAKNNEVNVINNFNHLGYGGSLQVGYRYALSHGFNYTIQMDADGQHDPCNIVPIFNELTGHKNKDNPDIVLGSRFLKDSVSFKISAAKKFAVWYFSKILKACTKQQLTDPTTGLQGLSKAVIYYYSQFDQFDGKYPDSNILLEAARAGFTIKEIPAVMHAREDGTSMHSGFKPVIYMLYMTISVISVLFRKDLRQRYLRARKYSLGI